MLCRRVFIVWVFAFSALFSACTAVTDTVNTFDGTIKLYSSTYYNDPLLTVNFTFPNQCYNVDCTALDNKIESAKWEGLPTTGIDGKAYIVFYEDFDCKGYSTAITLPHFGGIRDFDVQKVKGNISAFKVKSEADEIDNGSAYICMWTGAYVVGGSVSETDSISMVVTRTPST
ncbi:hypothetical protein PRNP1_010648 [Phytophthora ramorum]